ncbi:hypothetical protein DFH09DRAFT_1492819 [Mycena vulgaris]|nr:hypothetical protein DFH09DRAFT_1492819 [Mycena vulgaris]
MTGGRPTLSDASVAGWSAGVGSAAPYARRRGTSHLRIGLCGVLARRYRGTRAEGVEVSAVALWDGAGLHAFEAGTCRSPHPGRSARAPAPDPHVAGWRAGPGAVLVVGRRRSRHLQGENVLLATELLALDVRRTAGGEEAAPPSLARGVVAADGGQRLWDEDGGDPDTRDHIAHR